MLAGRQKGSPPFQPFRSQVALQQIDKGRHMALADLRSGSWRPVASPFAIRLVPPTRLSKLTTVDRPYEQRWRMGRSRCRQLSLKLYIELSLLNKVFAGARQVPKS